LEVEGLALVKLWKRALVLRKWWRKRVYLKIWLHLRHRSHGH